MKKLLFPLLAFVLFCSHDMFLKMDTYFLQPNTKATIQLFNGTWEESDNVITRDRMIDVSLVGNGTRTRLDTTQWTESGKVTLLNFTTGEPGTWVAGLSTRSRDFGQTAEAFNRYLKHDGVIDMIAARERDGTTNDPVVERYSKHVKAIYQVGEKMTDDYTTPLGYPIEFVPLENPYERAAGEFLRVQLLLDGEPLPNQVVYAVTDGAAHSHTHADGEDHTHDEEDEDHTHTSGTQLRTNDSGIIVMPLPEEGISYLRTIYMETKDTEGLTHESNWATLTFEVGHGHAHGAHTHGDGEHTHDGTTHSHDGDDHAHEEETLFGLPSTVYYLGSFVLVAGFFFWFNRKSA